MSDTKPPVNHYHTAQFILSAGKLSQLPEDSGREVAFAGRSNAGKSSALNTIAAQRSLARTSKTPGRTQLINMFELDADRRLIDLPGYGFAKVPVAIKRHWEKLLESYLRERQSLVGLMMMMDVRHPMKEYDRQMLQWCSVAGMQVHILLTKADKLKRGPAGSTLQKVRAELKRDFPGCTVQLFSATAKTGVEEARRKLDSWLGYAETPDDERESVA